MILPNDSPTSYMHPATVFRSSPRLLDSRPSTIFAPLSKTCPPALAVSRLSLAEQKDGKMHLHRMSNETLGRHHDSALCARIVATAVATTDIVQAPKSILIRSHHPKSKSSILTRRKDPGPAKLRNARVTED